MTTQPSTEREERTSGLAIALSIAALVVGFALLPRLFTRSEGPLAGKAAPDVPLAFVANAPAEGDTTIGALKGRAVLLDFWATWCGPCQAEAPVVDSIARRYKDQGLAVVGVNTSDEQGAAAPWAARHHITYPIAYDAANRAAAAYGVENLPTLVVIGRDGKIVAVRMGITSDAELDALVKRVL